MLFTHEGRLMPSSFAVDLRRLADEAATSKRLELKKAKEAERAARAEALRIQRLEKARARQEDRVGGMLRLEGSVVKRMLPRKRRKSESRPKSAWLRWRSAGASKLKSARGFVNSVSRNFVPKFIERPGQKALLDGHA